MTNTIASPSLLTPLISSAAMRAVLDDRARLQRMLNFEVALARAEAAVGVVPASITERIAEACRAERYDIAALATQAIAAGNIAIPLVKALTAEVAKANAEAARYVHWGATSQDVIDTALVLDLRDGIDALVADLNRAIDGFSALAGRHRRNAAVARTFLQHALPMPFGLKLSGYAAALARSRERLRRLRREALALQFGGAAGTLAELGERGLVVSERLAALLDLALPDAPWHGHSDRLAEVAAAIAILTGTCGKIARDITLLMQTEIAEAYEPAGEERLETLGGARKSEPTAAAIALGAATIAPNLLATIIAGQVQEHERGVGGWQAQWQAFPMLLFVTSGALGAIADIAQGLDVDAERMRKNLEVTNGLILADAVAMLLAQKIGKNEAQKLVQEDCQKAVSEKRHLHDILREDLRVGSHITVGELARLFELMGYQGSAQTFIDRQIGSLQSRGPKRP
jgi:3-carboxy-cis,cis-muconate cycloisomerase